MRLPRLCERPEVDDGPPHVHVPRQAHRLPLVPGLGQGQLLQVLVDEVGDPEEILGPDLMAEPGPGGEGPSSGSHGVSHVLAVGVGEEGVELLSGGVYTKQICAMYISGLYLD